MIKPLYMNTNNDGDSGDIKDQKARIVKVNDPYEDEFPDPFKDAEDPPKEIDPTDQKGETRKEDDNKDDKDDNKDNKDDNNKDPDAVQ